MKDWKDFNEAQNNCLLQIVDYKVPSAEISQRKYLCVYSGVNTQKDLWFVFYVVLEYLLIPGVTWNSVVLNYFIKAILRNKTSWKWD